jgi:hypothetical protein
MKKTAVIIGTLFLLILIGCKQEPVNPIEGAWNLIYVKTIANDSVVSQFPLTYQGSDIKIWTKENWSFVASFKQDTITWEGYGGGNYTMNGNIYMEYIVFHSDKNLIGQKLRMLMTVKNDTLIQIWPVDEEGTINKSDCTVERYARLK